MESGSFRADEVIKILNQILSLLGKTARYNFQEVSEKMVAINSYLDPNKRANLEEVNRTQKNINKSQYRMKALVSTLCGLAESALDGLECSVEEKTVVKEFCRRYNKELLPEVHVLDGSAKEVIKSLEMSQMVIRTMRSANTTATMFSTTTQTTSLGSSSRLVIGITCSLGAGAIMAALATIESPLAKIVAVASIVSALAFFLPKFQRGQRTMLPEPTEEIEENSLELLDRLEETMSILAAPYTELTRLLETLINTKIDWTSYEDNYYSFETYINEIKRSCNEYLNR